MTLVELDGARASSSRLGHDHKVGISKQGYPGLQYLQNRTIRSPTSGGHWENEPRNTVTTSAGRLSVNPVSGTLFSPAPAQRNPYCSNTERIRD